VARLYRVVGPPGTGKTTWVARQCQHAVGVHGPDRVLVASLTRAAAREAAGRDTGLAKGQVGTLHSHCYHALGRPRIVDAALCREWNAEHPLWQLTVGNTELEKGEALGVGDGPAPGDRLLMELDLARARMQPRAGWSSQLAAFGAAWDDFKQNVGACDFTDLIEQGCKQLRTAPGVPGALFIDEAQDLSALELELVSRWAELAETTVLVGDPYQALYHWRGAGQDVMSGELHKVLDQSYRVPRAVQAQAMSIIRQTGAWRAEIIYRPRETEGAVHRVGATWKDPAILLDLMAALPGRVMVIAACDYMIHPLRNLLRSRGIPYHNPFTHRWNPLREGTLDKVRSMLRFAAPKWGGPEPDDMAWRPEELRSWLPLLRSARTREDEAGAKLRGAPEPTGETETDGRVYAERHLARPAVTALLRGDLEWLHRSATKAGWDSISYAVEVLRRNGWRALCEPPRVILGTIHSVKGGEAEHVVVFPDLSPAGIRSYQHAGWDHHDGVWRMFYVAATRARESLTIAGAANTTMAVPL